MTELIREEMMMTISDLTKEVYGFRVRKDYASYTTAELTKEYQSLLDQLEVVMEDEKREKEAAVLRFEAYIKGMMTDHGIDRATAVRWDMEAEDITDDIGYYLWKKGLPYDFENTLMRG